MKKSIKILLILAAGLLLLGGVLFAIGFGVNGFQWSKIGNTKLEMQYFTEQEGGALSEVTIDYENADVDIMFDASAERVTIEYPQLQLNNGKNVSKITVEETAEKITIREKAGAWIFGLWDFTSPKVKVILPAERTYALTIKTDNGDVKVTGDGKVKAVTLETDNGDVHAKTATIACEGNLIMTADNGEIYLFKNFDTDSLYVETDNSDIYCYGGTARGKIEIESDNGDIEMSSGVLKGTDIVMETENGDIELSLLEGERISLTSDVGDIETTIAGRQVDYTVKISIDVGKSNIGNSVGGAKTLMVENDVGDIDIYFTEN